MGDTDTSVIVDEYIKQKDIICEKMANGIPFKYACLLGGISESTGYRLRYFKGKSKERLEELEKKDTWDPEEAKEREDLLTEKSLCDSFDSRCEAARASYLQLLVTRINIGALKSPGAAMEILRTQFSDEYNVAKKIEHSGEVVTGAKELAETLQKIYERRPIAPRAEGSDQGDSQ